METPIARLDRERRFGFLMSSDSREIYCHRSSVLDDKFTKPETYTIADVDQYRNDRSK